MDETIEKPISEAADAGPDDDLPPGSHALEVAARRGFGPLSPAARQSWHGNAVPCVTCGQLVHRGALQCDHCSQDLRAEMVDKMRAHAGPWFVLEHLRPFPGVSLERIIRQIRRGLITETSIVRGPATDYHWRFAVETPGLCLYFGRCWHCHNAVTAAEVYCPACLSHLSLDPARPTLPGASPKPTAAPPIPPQVAPPLVGRAAATADRVQRATAVAVSSPDSSELNDLASAIRSLGPLSNPAGEDAVDLLAEAQGWIVAAALLIAIAALLAIVQIRSEVLAPSSTADQGTSNVR